MTIHKRLGLTLPEDAFEKLRPYRTELLAMSTSYRAGGPEYMALSRAVIALDEAANIVMNRPGFYHAMLHKT